MEAPSRFALVKPAPDAPLETLKREFGAIIVSTVQKISALYRNNLKNYKTDFTALTKGLWSQREFYKALNVWKDKNPQAAALLKWLVEHDRFYQPHPFKGVFAPIIDASSPTGFHQTGIQLAKGVSPSEAMDQIVNHNAFAMLNCLAVCQIGVYRALQETLGNEKFDKLFNYETGSPIRLGFSPNGSLLLNFLFINPVDYFLTASQETGKAKGERDVEVGSLAYFHNLRMYNLKHLIMRPANGFNVVCNKSEPGQQRYVGLGAPEEGSDEKAFEELMLEEYNAAPISAEVLRPKLAQEVHKSLHDVAKRVEDPPLHVSSVEINKFACRFFAEPTAENLRNVGLICEQQGISSAKINSNLQELIKLSIPLSTKDVKDPDFGFNETQIFSYKFELIDALVKMPLEQVSMDFVRSFKNKELIPRR